MIAACTVMYLISHYDKNNTPWTQRWWLYGIGLSSGLALSVKISGIYYPFVFGVCIVFYALFSGAKTTPLLSAKRMKNVAACITHGLFCLLCIPLFIFTLSYRSFFTDELSYYHTHNTSSGEKQTTFITLYDQFPTLFANFVNRQAETLQFHSSLTTSGGYTHPWESKPWQWLFGDRPLLAASELYTLDDGTQTEAKLWIMGNLCIWMLAIPLIIYGLYKIIRKDIRFIISTGGFLTGIIPWMIAYERQMYIFYCTALAPFLVLMVIFTLQDISEAIVAMTHKKIAETGRTLIITYLLVTTIAITPAVSFFAHYSPWVYYTPLTKQQQESRTLFPTWSPIGDATYNMNWKNINIIALLTEQEPPEQKNEDTTDPETETPSCTDDNTEVCTGGE